MARCETHLVAGTPVTMVSVAEIEHDNYGNYGNKDNHVLTNGLLNDLAS